MLLHVIIKIHVINNSYVCPLVCNLLPVFTFFRWEPTNFQIYKTSVKGLRILYNVGTCTTKEISMISLRTLCSDRYFVCLGSLCESRLKFQAGACVITSPCETFLVFHCFDLVIGFGSSFFMFVIYIASYYLNCWRAVYDLALYYNY